MNIALDYDNCYTQDPECWDKVIGLLQEAGHNVMIVTMRGEDEPVSRNLADRLSVYYTCRRAKRNFMVLQGVLIDVWIDDTPDAILHDFIQIS